MVGTYKDVGQLATLDPYAGPMSAETIAWQAGTRQGYVGAASVAGADFGSDGASALSARVLPKAGGVITLSTLPDPEETTSLLGTITVPAGNGETWSDLLVGLPTGSLAGVNDVFSATPVRERVSCSTSRRGRSPRRPPRPRIRARPLPRRR